MAAARAAEARDRRRPRPRPAARHAGRHQGHHRRRRPADHLPLEDPARQHRARPTRWSVAKLRAGRRDHPGQAVHARIRHRRPQLRSAVPAGAQSVEPRRIIPGGSSSGSGAGVVRRAVSAGARHRHRRLGAQSGQRLRHRRAEADLWPGLAARRVPAVLHAGSCRPADPHRRRQRTAAGGDRRATIRPIPAAPPPARDISAAI